MAWGHEVFFFIFLNTLLKNPFVQISIAASVAVATQMGPKSARFLVAIYGISFSFKRSVKILVA